MPPASTMTGPVVELARDDVGQWAPVSGFDDRWARAVDARGAEVRKYVVTRTRWTYDAATTCPADVREYCVRDGYEPRDIVVATSGIARVLTAAREIIRLLWLVLTMGRDDIVAVQFPLASVFDAIVATCARGRTIAIVHDVEHVRYGRDPELDRVHLQRYDAIVVTTDAMAGHVAELIPQARHIFVMQLWGCLVADDLEPVRGTSPGALYVIGNLDRRKARYLYELTATEVPVIAYGPNCATSLLPPNVEHRGILDLTDPGVRAVDGFGLVWDGLSPDGIGGPLGEYLFLTASGKLSSYLAAGMPVIVPDGAAVAPLVEREGIGFTASNVYEAAKRVRDCTPAEWRSYCDAVLRLRDEVIHGRRLRAAVRSAEESLRLAA